MASQSDLMWFITYLIIGLYFINSALLFYQLPEQLSLVDKWIRLVGGALVVIGGINHLRAKRYSRRYHASQ